MLKFLLKRKLYHQLVLDNLRRLKGSLPLYNYEDDILEYPIFSLGINHFFYNGLGGQAAPFKPFQNFIFRGGKANDDPISPLGKKVIKLMIDKILNLRPETNKVDLRVFKWNENAIKLYLKLGFKIIPNNTLTFNYSKNETWVDVNMQKQLKYNLMIHH